MAGKTRVGFTKNDADTPESVETKRAKAFVNWSIPTKDGGVIKSYRGFPIWCDPKYPNKPEELLLKLAQRASDASDGEVTYVDLTMKVRVMLNTEAIEYDLDDIELLVSSK